MDLFHLTREPEVSLRTPSGCEAIWPNSARARDAIASSTRDGGTRDKLHAHRGLSTKFAAAPRLRSAPPGLQDYFAAGNQNEQPHALNGPISPEHVVFSR